MNSTTQPSQVQIGPQPLGAVKESETDNIGEYIGYLTFSTTGEVLVPRTWLKERWESIGLPENLLPKKPSRWSAYRRTMQSLLDDNEIRTFEASVNSYQQSFRNIFELEKSNAMGTNVFILYLKTFYPESLIGEEGGDWRRQRVGFFDFKQDDDMPGQMTFRSDIDEGGILLDKTMRVQQHANGLFETMQSHHNQADMQKVMDQTRERSNAVPIRRAVYFVPSHYGSVVEGLSVLWEGMNRFKNDGEVVRIETTPVVNLESQREMVADRANQMVEEIVDDIIGETMEVFEDDDEMTADATAREILNQLSDAYDIESEYNALLSMRMSVEEILEKKRNDLKEEQEEIINSVLNQNSLEDY